MAVCFLLILIIIIETPHVIQAPDMLMIDCNALYDLFNNSFTRIAVVTASLL